MFNVLLLYHLVWLHRLGRGTEKNNHVPPDGGMMAQKMALPFITLNISYYSLMACSFCFKNLLIALGKFLVFYLLLFFALRSIISLSLIVVILITMCLDAFLFGLALHGTLLPGLRDLFLFPVREVLIYYLFKYFLGLLHSLLSFWDIWNLNIIVLHGIQDDF